LELLRLHSRGARFIFKGISSEFAHHPHEDTVLATQVLLGVGVFMQRNNLIVRGGVRIYRQKTVHWEQTMTHKQDATLVWLVKDEWDISKALESCEWLKAYFSYVYCVWKNR
jgi:hypothetical protein